MALKIVHHLVELYFLDVPCIARVIVIQALYWTFSIFQSFDCPVSHTKYHHSRGKG